MGRVFSIVVLIDAFLVIPHPRPTQERHPAAAVAPLKLLKAGHLQIVRFEASS